MNTASIIIITQIKTQTAMEMKKITVKNNWREKVKIYIKKKERMNE